MYIVCVCVSLHACMYVYWVCVCVYACMYVCICTYIHTEKQPDIRTKGSNRSGISQIKNQKKCF